MNLIMTKFVEMISESQRIRLNAASIFDEKQIQIISNMDGSQTSVTD